MGALLTLFAGGAAAAPPTYATWNPLDRFTPDADPALGVPTLSTDLLTASYGGGWFGCRATIGNVDVDEYFEATVDNSGAGGAPYVGVGVAAASQVLTYMGDNGGLGWGVMSHGYTCSPSSAVSNGSVLSSGTVVGVANIRSTNTVKVYTISGGVGTLIATGDISAASGLGLFPFATVLGGTITANFGATAFAISAVPDGCRSGVYA